MSRLANPSPGPQTALVQTVDIVVVGAGPAGAAAAITAARGGLDVLVVDRARFPRDKCCGDGLTALALRELEALGLDPTDVPSWCQVTEVVLHGPDDARTALRLPDDGVHAAVARRADLDHALVALTRSVTEVREGTEVTAVSVDTAGITVTADDGPVRARTVIAADGMWSPVRRMVGADPAPGYRGDWHAFRLYVVNVAPPARDGLHVFFEKDLLPGYAWSFPLADGRANVGFGVQRSDGGTGSLSGKELARLGATLLDRPALRTVLGPDASPEGPVRAWPIPARFEHATLDAADGRVLVVGDAATATDPLTGEGIGQALLTGRLAAEAVLARPWDPPAAAAHYRRTARSHLVADHRLADLLIGPLRRPGGVRLTLRAVDTCDWTRRNFARWMFEDYPRALLATPRRWHRGMLRPPGAYRNTAG